MKKMTVLILALTLIVSLAACGRNEEPTNVTTNPETTVSTTDQTTEGTTESTTGATDPEETQPSTQDTKPTETEPAETIPAHTHNYTSKITQAATCTEKGIKTFTCSCGESYTEDMKATGHAHSAKTTQEPTCAAAGVKTYTCSCGDTYTESIPTTAHSHTMKITADATGKDEGTKTYTCTCGNTYTETFKLSTIFKGFIDDINHAWNNSTPDYEYGTGEGFTLVYKYAGFSTTDGIHFTVNYQAEYYDSMEEPPFQTTPQTLCVVLTNNQFVKE